MDLRKGIGQKGACTCNRSHNKCEIAIVQNFRWTPEKLEEMRLDYSYYSVMMTKLDKVV